MIVPDSTGFDLHSSDLHSWWCVLAVPLLPLPQVAATAGEEGLKFLLICGRPIGEPIVQCEQSSGLF